MLDRAQSLLLQILDELSPEIEAGIPIVGLEPSCSPSFAMNSSTSFPTTNGPGPIAPDFPAQRVPRNPRSELSFAAYQPQAILHGHCHHKSLMKMTAEESVLRRLGVDFHSPAPGCCGMAGSFGFEQDKYDLSITIGEMELLPAVRQAPPTG